MPPDYYRRPPIAIGDDLSYAFEFFLRIRPSLHSHGAQEHLMHAIAGMEK